MDDDTRRAAARAPEPTPELDPAPDSEVTGVARGALGTGTALEETQEWILPDYVPANPHPAAPVAAQATVQDEEAAAPAAVAVTPAVAAAPAVSPAAPAVAAPAPVAQPTPVSDAGPVHAATSAGRHGSRFGGLPGLAAIAILAVMGGAIVLASLPPGESRDGLLPGAESTPAATPASADDDGDDDDGVDGDDDDSDGGGGGNNKGKGNNNGRGNGGGGGRGNN